MSIHLVPLAVAMTVVAVPVRDSVFQVMDLRRDSLGRGRQHDESTRLVAIWALFAVTLGLVA
jgi:hypothetical protein